jgi:hypothetical protein
VLRCPGQARRKEPRDRWATLRNLIGIDIIDIMRIMTSILMESKSGSSAVFTNEEVPISIYNFEIFALNRLM